MNKGCLFLLLGLTIHTAACDDTTPSADTATGLQTDTATPDVTAADVGPAVTADVTDDVTADVTTDIAVEGETQGARPNVFTRAFETEPTLAFATPTATGFELRFSSGTATCADYREVLVQQYVNLQVIIDGLSEAVDAGFLAEDEDMFSSPNLGETRVSWVGTGLDTLITAYEYRIEVTSRTAERLVGNLRATFDPIDFRPIIDLQTGLLEGDFDVEICPAVTPAR